MRTGVPENQSIGRVTLAVFVIAESPSPNRVVIL